MRIVPVLRRSLLTIFGVQIALAVILTLVDSYRRRGKKPRPFPTRPAATVNVGSGTIRTYTYGRDLYEDMISAIESAKRQVLLETYIWKGDAVGQQFKSALERAAARGVEVYVVTSPLPTATVSGGSVGKATIRRLPRRR